MAEGYANDGICARLQLGPKTVETHVSHIFRKLGLEEQVGHRRVLAVLHQLRADSDAGAGDLAAGPGQAGGAPP
jgi:DNA-binding NarL/FixJ family response regulator